MSFIKEFKEFAIKGNVVDLAVAVVLGGAFGAIVTALTESIIMPLISLVLGSEKGVSGLSYMVRGTVFPYGVLLQSIINFILIALVLFSIIKAMNMLNRSKEEPVVAAEPEYTLSEKLLMEIRDNLKK